MPTARAIVFACLALTTLAAPALADDVRRPDKVSVYFAAHEDDWQLFMNPSAFKDVIKDAAKTAVIVKSGNMSLGVNLLAALTRRVAKTLDNSFDIEILEMHHNQKVDAPSGTALMLGRAAAEGRGIDLDRNSVRGRDGNTGARHAGDIGFANLRGGSVVGEHTVIFAGPAERLELVHKAEDRMIFARGALHAALWARTQKPGLYSMADVLGLGNF